eukprot:m.683256 g.683256  ORF g.683256 m.683256 type:complete len:375 (+) comp22828_c1_seq1:212-1336(+)
MTCCALLSFSRSICNSVDASIAMPETRKDTSLLGRQRSIESKLRACGFLTLVHGLCQGWGLLEDRIGSGNGWFRFDGNEYRLSPVGFGVCYLFEGAVGIALVVAHSQLLQGINARNLLGELACSAYAFALGSHVIANAADSFFVATRKHLAVEPSPAEETLDWLHEFFSHQLILMSFMAVVSLEITSSGCAVSDSDGADAEKLHNMDWPSLQLSTWTMGVVQGFAIGALFIGTGCAEMFLPFALIVASLSLWQTERSGHHNVCQQYYSRMCICTLLVFGIWMYVVYRQTDVVALPTFDNFRAFNHAARREADPVMKIHTGTHPSHIGEIGLGSTAMHSCVYPCVASLLTLLLAFFISSFSNGYNKLSSASDLST